MLTAATIILTAVITTIVGVLIGAIGIGGVVLVPVLTYILGLDIHVAIATAMFTYLFSGGIGAIEYARRGSIRWTMALWLCAGGMPGAYLGAVTAWMISGTALEIIIGMLVLFAGLQAFRRHTETQQTEIELHPFGLATVGLVTGFASAITGTGGPLVLIPILIWLQIPILTAIGLSQVIQIPIALLATTGNMLFGTIEFGTGIGIAILLMIGVIMGTRVAHRVSRDILKRVTAFALLMVGGSLLARTLAMAL